MERALSETRRRRERQLAYNEEHGIEPKTVIKDIHNPLVAMSRLDYHPQLTREPGMAGEVAEAHPDVPLSLQIEQVEKEMKAAAKRLEFEEAAVLRDRLRELKQLQIYRA